MSHIDQPMPAGQSDELKDFVTTEKKLNLVEALERLEIAKKGDNEALIFQLATNLIANFPDETHARLVAAVAFNGVGKLVEENGALEVARRRFPENVPLALRWALSSHYRCNWTEAAERWTFVRNKWPQVPDGFHWGVSAYREGGELEHAQELLDQALVMFPENDAVDLEAALLAARGGNWALALKHWEALDKRAPGQTRVAEGIAKARLGMLYAEADLEKPAVRATEKPIVSVERSRPALEDNRLLMFEFESLGVDCEFGLVQRAFGAEPLGLLRWGGAQVENLISGLEKNLSGLGEEIELELIDIGGEYYLHDSLYNINMHTFIQTAGADKQKILSQMSRRMQFLLQLFLSNLNDAKKIFVYKDKEAATESQIIALHDVLSRYGPVVLLFVQRAQGQPSGTKLLRDRLFHTRLERLGSDPMEGYAGWNVPLDDWIKTLRYVYETLLDN